MTSTTTYANAELRSLVAEKLAENPDFMPQTLADSLGVPVRRIIEALPDEMRSRAPGEAFIPIWEAMAGWEKVTFMAVTPGAVLEIPCRLPKGKAGHGMYNLMDKNSPLRGHLLMARVDSIWFVSKQVFGLESHSVQFYDAAGDQCFGVYLGRDEKRQIIPSVKEGFLALKARYSGGAPCKNGDQCDCKEGPGMRTLVVYSSRTGNTRMIAEAIHSIMPAGAGIFPVESVPDPADYDFIALGFWVDKGAPDAAMSRYMERVRGKSVGLFGTLGAWPDSDHARESMQKAVERVAGNRVLGTFLCQGKVDPQLLAAMANMSGNNPHPMTEERKARLEEAAKHPNEADCENARNVFAGIMRRLEAPCAR